VNREKSDTLLIYGKEFRCPGCGCTLSPYEVFACRIRGLETPMCMGCAFEAVALLRDVVWPTLDEVIKLLKAE